MRQPRRRHRVGRSVKDGATDHSRPAPRGPRSRGGKAAWVRQRPPVRTAAGPAECAQMSRSRLRIVHVVATDAFAGVERHVARLAASQHDAGHDVSVIGSAPTPMAAALGRPAVRCVPATTLTAAVRALGRAGRVDVVNVHMTAAEVAAALSPGLRRVPIVATRHFAARRGSTPAARVFTRLTSHRIAAQIAVSEYVAAHVEGRSTVVVSGVPGATRHPECRSAPSFRARRAAARGREGDRGGDRGLRRLRTRGRGVDARHRR